MADAAPKTESMEEILQSIKRIMDDNTGPEAKPVEPEVYELTNGIKDPAPSAAVPPPAPKVPSIEDLPQAATLSPEPEPAVYEPEDDSSLMSKQAKSAAASAFKQIEAGKRDIGGIPIIPSPQFRSGVTLEELVLETLRPMLKAWLDENLPIIAQKIVEKEVKRIVTFHYGQN